MTEIEMATPFPKARESDNLHQRSKVARAVGGWCKVRVPEHVGVGAVLPVRDDGNWIDVCWVWLDDDRGLPGGDCSCISFAVSYGELCQADAARIVSLRLEGKLAELETYQREETERRLAQARGKA